MNGYAAFGTGCAATAAVFVGGYFLFGGGSIFASNQTFLREASSVGTTAGTRSILHSKEGLICAEPSPDVMLALVSSAELGGSGEAAGGGKLSALGSFMQESRSQRLFERSQGIQALRDGMYRLCEANLNHAISREVYTEQMSDLIATLNFIVPIELCSRLSEDLVELINTPLERPPNTPPAAPAAAGEGSGETAAEGDQAAASVGGAGALPDSKSAPLFQMMTYLLDNCIKKSYDFGTQISANSGKRTIERMAHERDMYVVKYKMVSVLMREGMDCAAIIAEFGRELPCEQKVPVSVAEPAQPTE